MVGFTIEDLEERRKVFEAANTEKYGYYYERPVRYIPVVLSPKAVETMSATEKKGLAIVYGLMILTIFDLENKL